MQSKLEELIVRLTVRLKRVPTEDEVYDFIYGSSEDRLRIWNKGILNP